MDADDYALQIFTSLSISSAAELPSKFKSVLGADIREAYKVIGVSRLAELVPLYPEYFVERNGQVCAVTDEESAHIRDHMARSNPSKSRRGGRGGGGGGYRGGRGGGSSGRGGGFGGGYGAAFGSGAQRGGGARGGGGYNRGGPSRGSSSGFGSGGTGFGGGGGGPGPGFPRVESSGGFGGRSDPPPPVASSNHSSSRGRDDRDYQRSDNRGFASNYDDFAETSKRGNNYDDARDDRGGSYSSARRDDRYDDHYERDPAPRGGGGGGRDRYDDYDRPQEREVPRFDAYNEPRRGDDRRGDGFGERRGGGGGGGYGYSEDEDEEYDRRRRDEPRGGGGGFGQRRTPDYDRRPDRHAQHDDRMDRHYEDEERVERQERKFPSAFPSAFAGGSVSGSNVFAPTPMYRDNAYDIDDGDRRGGDDRRRSNEPEDPVNAKEACLPRDTYNTAPPGFEDALQKLRPPPGLANYRAGPPPGLGEPMLKTPSQRDGEADPHEVTIEEMVMLVFDACRMEGGRDIPKSEIIGKILKHCERDVTKVVQVHGGLTRVLEIVCERASNKMEFFTTEAGEDVVALCEPYRRKAQEKYGRPEDEPKNGLPDEIDDDDDSYQSARSSGQLPYAASLAPPVKSEIKCANDLWMFARTQGQYRSQMDGYGISIKALEAVNKMGAAGLYKFIQRPEFAPFFRLEFKGDVCMVYSQGPAGPLQELSGEQPEERDVRTMSRGGSTYRSSGHGSGRGRGGDQRDERERGEALPSPGSFHFFHKRDDPEVGYTTARSYKRKEEVILTTFVDFYDFYVVPEKDMDALYKMAGDLYDDHSGLPFLPAPHHWKEGYVGCWIQPKEKRAYRVMVISVDEDKGEMRVQRVDYADKHVIEFRDIVPLRESYKTNSYCFKCSLEDYEPMEEDDLMDLKRSMIKYRELKATIEPQEKLKDNTLIVTLTFSPPGVGGERRYPDDLYRKHFTKPR